MVVNACHANRVVRRTFEEPKQGRLQHPNLEAVGPRVFDGDAGHRKKTVGRMFTYGVFDISLTL